MSTYHTTIHFRRVHDLGIFRPNDFTACSNHTQLARIDFNDRTLCQNTKLRVHWTLRVLLDSDNGQLESGLSVDCDMLVHGNWAIRHGLYMPTFSSGCVTLAFLHRRAMGRMKRSILGGLRVNAG